MEEKPAELPVSEQEVQLQPPNLLDKIKIHKFQILGGFLGVLVFTGAVFGAYRFGQKQVGPGPKPTLTPGLTATSTPIQEVTIATDKTEYEQGETIKITVRNGLDVPVLYYGGGDRF